MTKARQTSKKNHARGAILAVMLVGGSWLMLQYADAPDVSELPDQSGEFDVFQSRLLSGPHIRETKTGSYLAGRFAAGQGDLLRAADFLEGALERDPENNALLTEVYQYKLLSGNLDEAVALAKRLDTQEVDAFEPSLLLALHHTRLGDMQGARARLEQIPLSGFNTVFVPLLENWIKLGEGSLTEPVTMPAGMEHESEFRNFVLFQLALANEAAGHSDTARAQYDELASRMQRIPLRIAEVMASFYAREGNRDKALDIIDRYNARSSEHLLPTALAESGQQVIRRPSDGLAEVFFGLSTILYNLNAHEDALIQLQVARHLRPDFPAAVFLQASVMEQHGFNEAARELYDAIPAASPLKTQAVIRAAFIKSSGGGIEEALRRLDDLSRDPDRTFEAMLAKGDILRSEERYKESVTAYDRAVLEITKPGVEHWPVFYARGISQERVGDWPAAEADLKKALELRPNQPDVLNYLGYSWLTKRENIDEARRMIETAMKARPDDAQIIDSMGWGLFIIGNYQEAVGYIERAAELAPRDATVNEHLGDVYWKLGRKLEARYQWKRALTFDPSEPGQKESIERKLAEGLHAVPIKQVAEEAREEHTSLRPDTLAPAAPAPSPAQ